jgi:hypothetical protein
VFKHQIRRQQNITPPKRLMEKKIKEIENIFHNTDVITSDFLKCFHCLFISGLGRRAHGISAGLKTIKFSQTSTSLMSRKCQVPSTDQKCTKETQALYYPYFYTNMTFLRMWDFCILTRLFCQLGYIYF